LKNVRKFIRMSIIQNLLLKRFVIFCKYVVSKVSCLVSVSARLSLGFVSNFCSKFRSRNVNVGLEDFGRDSNSGNNFLILLGSVPLSYTCEFAYTCWFMLMCLAKLFKTLFLRFFFLTVIMFRVDDTIQRNMNNSKIDEILRKTKIYKS